jgi:hypothetical protein
MAPPSSDKKTLSTLQKATFGYFWEMANPANGLVADNSRKEAPASIAVVGLALAAYPVGVERGFITRRQAITRTLATLRFFWDSPQGVEPDATGYQGFYYHFLDMASGQRTGQCELSTIDTALLLAGALTAGAYFDGDTGEEREIRELAEALYQRADWQWAQNSQASGETTVTHGWRPEHGFLPYRWQGYNEAMLLYLLGLGSPTHPLSAASYTAWTAAFDWKKIYDQELLYAGPLFIHQYTHIWMDLRGLQDEFMRAHGSDYFKNSRRATYVQREYAMRNPLHFKSYGQDCWGLTASEGPGPAQHIIDSVERRFFGYAARGAPYGPDDGTVAPWGVATSLPFAPEIVLPTLQNLDRLYPSLHTDIGCRATINPTFPDPATGECGWVSPWHFGLNQGPIVLMIENYRSGLIWQLTRRCRHVMTGLRRAGFQGGWLSLENLSR